MFIRRKLLILSVMLLMSRDIYANVIFDQVGVHNNDIVLRDGQVTIKNERINELHKLVETNKKTSESKDIYRQKSVWYDPSDITKMSHMDVETMKKILIANNRPETAKVAQDYLDAEDKYGINAWFMIGIQIAESGDWSSNFAKNRNNAWGIGAFDTNPNNAAKYKTRRDGIMRLAEIIKTSEYFVAGGRKSTQAIADKWCSDPGYWVLKINTQVSKFKSLEKEV